MPTIVHPLHPEEAQYLASAYPQLLKINGTNFPVSALAFDDTNDEAGFWKVVARGYVSGNLTAKLYWEAASANSGNVVWEAQIACITPNTDSQDIETKSFAAVSFVQDAHLGTVGKRLHECSIDISSLDSLAAGDVVWIRIARDANGTNATDDMAGDARLVMVELSYDT